MLDVGVLLASTSHFDIFMGDIFLDLVLSGKKNKSEKVGPEKWFMLHEGAFDDRENMLGLPLPRIYIHPTPPSRCVWYSVFVQRHATHPQIRIKQCWDTCVIYGNRRWHRPLCTAHQRRSSMCHLHTRICYDNFGAICCKMYFITENQDY